MESTTAFLILLSCTVVILLYYIIYSYINLQLINKLLECKRSTNIKLIKRDRQYLDDNINLLKQILNVYFDVPII